MYEDGPQKLCFPHVSGTIGIQFFLRRLYLLLGDGRQPKSLQARDQPVVFGSSRG